MDIIDIYDQLMGVFQSKAFSVILSLMVIYLGILWVGIIWWVARDIMSRSNNLGFQVGSILLGLGFLPGMLIYFLIRPKKTIEEKYDEELERRAFLESISEGENECEKCAVVLKRDWIWCPKCGERVKNKCACGMVLEEGWTTCPGCGKMTSAKERRKREKEAKKAARLKKMVGKKK